MSASGSSDGGDDGNLFLSSAAAASETGRPQQQQQQHYGLLAVIPVIQREGLAALCRRAYDLPTLAALASEAARSEQLLATGCLLVQAVAVVRHWHLQAAPGQHPRKHHKAVKEYVCAFNAQGAVPCSGDSAAGQPTSLLARMAVGPDFRWRAAFAVQLYSALELPTFRSLEPWLFRTSLRTLQPLVTRFWREDRLDLMEQVLRVVDAQSATPSRVVAALAGWRSHPLDTGISDAQLKYTVDTYRQRLKEGPQLQQAYRQQRRQQRQLTLEASNPSARAFLVLKSETGPSPSSGASSSVAASISEVSLVALNPPLLDLFFLSSSNKASDFQTGGSMVAPPPQLWTPDVATAAVAPVPAFEEDAEGSMLNRVDAPRCVSSALTSLQLQSSEHHDAATLVALSIKGNSTALHSSDPRASNIPSLMPRRTSSRWSPPDVPVPVKEAMPSRRRDSSKATGAAVVAAAAAAAASAHATPPTSAKKKENKKRKRAINYSTRTSSTAVSRHSVRTASTASATQSEDDEVTGEEAGQSDSSDGEGEGVVNDDDDDSDDPVGDEGDVHNEHWTTSCADGFAGLMERYPLLLEHAQRSDGPTAEMHLRGGPAAAASSAAAADETALSCALIVHGLPAPSPLSRVAMQGELADSLVQRKVRKSVSLKLPTPKNGSAETRVRDSRQRSSLSLSLHPIFMVYDNVDESSEDDEEMEERKNQAPPAVVAIAWQLNKQYFVADMLLPEANKFMAEMVQQLFDGAGHHPSASIRAPLLSGILQGGAFAYVGLEGEVQLPHGVADWTTTHHLWNNPTSSQRHLSHAKAPYFPLYFHCESHRAGAVNWRMDDVRVVLDAAGSRMTSTRSASDASASDALPAYWLCVEPESDNLTLFQEVMSAAAATREASAGAAAATTSKEGRRTGKKARISSLAYSIDDLRAPSLPSVEPLLRAGVRMKLVTQRERDLVVLMPGTPHCVFTPPAATKISRNWTTPHALLAAAVRSLRGASGQRGEWIRDLQERPLQCLLPALRRLCMVEPEQFHRLSTHPTSLSRLSFVLSRAFDLAHTTEDEELQTVANQIANRMAHCLADAASATRAPPAQSLFSQQSESASSSAVAMDIVDSAAAAAANENFDDGEANDVHVSGAEVMTTSALSSLDCLRMSAEAQQGLLTSFATRCQAYREVLIARLRQECPLTSTLRMLDGMLLASVPPATVQELCTELVAQKSSSTTTQETVRAIDTALRQRHVREVKLRRQAVAEQGVHAALQSKLHRAGVALPDMWHKMIEFKQRIESVAPPQQYPPRMSLMEWRSSGTSQLSVQQLKLYRRLLLHDLAAFVAPSACVPGEPLLVFAAPESHNLLRWRAILCGSVINQMERESARSTLSGAAQLRRITASAEKEQGCVRTGATTYSATAGICVGFRGKFTYRQL